MLYQILDLSLKLKKLSAAGYHQLDLVSQDSSSEYLTSESNTG